MLARTGRERSSARRKIFKEENIAALNNPAVDNNQGKKQYDAYTPAVGTTTDYLLLLLLLLVLIAFEYRSAHIANTICSTLYTQ